MERKLISLDLDDCGLECADDFREYVNKVSGCNLKRHNQTTYNFSYCTDDYGNIPTAEHCLQAFENFILSRKYKNMKLIPGFRELTYKLKQEGYTVQISTARKVEDDKLQKIMEQDTYTCLKDKNIHYDTIIFNRNKKEVMKITKPLVHLDDAIKHLIGIQCFKALFHKHYNESEKSVTLDEFFKNPEKYSIPRIYDHDQTYHLIQYITHLKTQT